ncbi:hypothetical protein Cadr_000007597 [Camelus dromedarius]|uniref:Uncharacterized protein n=1 Tax=Camelus dromedarius TaxID=9838 RepID=A0A5N4E729_CAMDR|nr:hypothetical protein Cadr_000007597 [Camelus dromedarius]
MWRQDSSSLAVTTGLPALCLLPHVPPPAPWAREEWLRGGARHRAPRLPRTSPPAGHLQEPTNSRASGDTPMESASLLLEWELGLEDLRSGQQLPRAVDYSPNPQLRPQWKSRPEA